MVTFLVQHLSQNAITTAIQRFAILPPTNGRKKKKKGGQCSVLLGNGGSPSAICGFNVIYWKGGRKYILKKKKTPGSHKYIYCISGSRMAVLLFVQQRAPSTSTAAPHDQWLCPVNHWADWNVKTKKKKRYWFISWSHGNHPIVSLQYFNKIICQEVMPRQYNFPFLPFLLDDGDGDDCVESE